MAKAKIKASEVKELVSRCIACGNPYKKEAVKYYVGKQTHYIYAGKSYTEAELDKAYCETARKDIEVGYANRMWGSYDKWYRYNHADNGRAYDMGVQLATTKEGCSEEMTIIPCEYARY